MQFRKAAKISAYSMFLIVVCALLAQSAGASPGRSDPAAPARFAGNFAQVQVGLDERITLVDISSLPRAPGGQPQVLDDGKSVRVQLPAESVKALIEQGAEITVLRQFVLVQGGASQGVVLESDASPLAACSGTYYDDDNPYNVYIQNNMYWFGSGIDFSGLPGTPVVACIDVHYEVRNLDWISIVDVALSDEDYQSYMYTLENDWWGSDGDIIQTRTGITAFNGRALSQAWYLWAADYYADGYGYIDNWWIKLYYEEGPPEYCDASASNYSYEHISRVQVGDIDNATAGSNYTDYTHLCTVMKIQTGYQITVTNGYPYDQYDYCGVWVDWNQDKDFADAAETISVSPDQTTPTGGVITFAGTITPPAGAALGSTRMRVRILWKDTISPCGSTSYGEVEDYTIRIVPASWVPGDFVAPNGVDMMDYAVLAGQWRQAPGEPSADITPGCGDGVVDWFDLETLVDNWLVGVGP
ncbi:MAG TPA: GEVED domain-containing protein [Sedimentisphaerales bacterium]|nr:GEVED domain-containing protein [Sedimentisphaerales bacterium]